jgi:hypothetical protein
MDSPKRRIKIDPLSLEAEFRVLSVRRRLNELTREELEEFLSDSLTLLAKLAHQVTQLKNYLESEYEEG